MIPARANSARQSQQYARQIKGSFDEREFLSRLLTEDNARRAIGEVLQDPRILADVERRKRTEILVACHIDPCNPVDELTARKLERLCRSLARVVVARSRRQ